MDRRFRLTSSNEIMRVRRSGQSFAHPLVVLVIDKGGARQSRFAVTAGLSVGNAVKRNRAKRLLRAALQELLKEITPGYDILLIAREPLASSNCGEVKQVLETLLSEAGAVDNKKDG